MTIGASVFPSALRARIDGAVIRLPGTGDGVARLVPVSMVKVDMARASSERAAAPPARLFAAAEPLFPPGALRERYRVQRNRALVAKDGEGAADRAGRLVVAVAARRVEIDARA